MNQKALRTLEYDKIIDSLTELASSPSGKQLCRELRPVTNVEAIRQAQRETSDALSRIFKKGSISFGGIKDVRASLKRLEVGSTLNAIELLAVCTLLETANKVKTYSRPENDEAKPDALDWMFAALEPLTPISHEIRRCIISEEEISDDASAGLKQIRRSMKTINGKVHSQLSAMVSGSVRNYLQDSVVTMRNGRYCIPVKAEYRGQVPGMIHDQSSSGSTLFVEPMAVVKLNNDLRELEIREQKEIEKILAELSVQVAEQIPSIENNFHVLTKLDFIFAKGSFSKQYRGSEPRFNTEGIIRIKKGRHPLLDKNKVVPINIHLGKDFDQLIVTGPNTGGKTVSLKTVGLLTLMGQAGLHIPAFDRSQLSVFEEVFADIGDEQSIELSLSTFSSHMTNIVSILEQANERSLVLFDELCAGTDPTEGAALATSILSHLHGQGIRTMATTHYSELKVYALSTPRVENACCEFDIETLRPTYRLLIGIPGKSNAFAISSKLGLPDYIIEEARTHISDQDESFEDLIADLESKRKQIESERVDIANYKAEIKQLKDRLHQKNEKLDARRDKLLAEAREEAQKVLREAKDVADQTIRQFHKYGSEGLSIKDMENERNALREKMSGYEKARAKQQQKQQKSNKTKPKDLKLGDSVKVLSLGLNGTVSSLPNAKGDLYVQMGILRSQVNIKDIIVLDEPVITAPNMEKTRSGKIKMNKSATISAEIKLLGMTVDEALAELDKYLDDAYLSHLNNVRVVHGKGTGALRKAVHGHLRRHRYVESFRLGVFGEGEDGVTIVQFKD